MTNRPKFEVTKDARQWGKIVAKQIADSIKANYGAGWRHFGPSLRSDIAEGKIMGIMFNVERFSRGDLADGEFEGRARVVREALIAMNIIEA